jgi:hypothetical protein
MKTVILQTHTGKVFDISEKDCFHMHIDGNDLIVFKSNNANMDPVIRIPLTQGIEEEIPLLRLVNMWL